MSSEKRLKMSRNVKGLMFFVKSHVKNTKKLDFLG